ncbi:MAG TPA: methylmalonyl Co-A mutase-associated GTPase MeaB [Planctomycetota bacterium]|jgi:LAO/AO transport system kinase|nr:methylmalonyl Co-A mutase-associated GTPase MeaB [Planctomycetota bacterium]
MPLADEVLRGDSLAVSKAISLVENGAPEGRALLDAIAPRVGRALRVGVTGPPGVGKSTTLDELSAAYRARGEKVGILAVDPTSPFTGGALLGDRVRMAKASAGGDVFVRSMATRGAGGGLARATQDAADILDAAGCTIVLIETVGVGQSEIEVSRAADVVVVLLSPESGDGIQALKSGLLEIADLLVVNKADRPGAERLQQDLRSAFELGLRPRREVPILLAEAARGRGIGELVAAIDAFVAARRADGGFEERRRRNMETRIRQIAEFLVQRSLWDGGGARRLEEGAREVLARRRSPYQAAQELLQEALR